MVCGYMWKYRMGKAQRFKFNNSNFKGVATNDLVLFNHLNRIEVKITLFKIKFDPEKEKKIIKPEDLLPKTVENTRGELQSFQPEKIVSSLMKETGLDRKNAEKITTSVLRKISTLGLDFVAAPHLREL